jgi:hypothetical protein
MLPFQALAENVVSVRAAAVAPGTNGNGTMSAAAARAMKYGALPASEADVRAKAAADRAYDEAAAAGALRAGSSGDVVVDPGPAASSPQAVLVSGRSYAGQTDAGSTPPDTTGAVGTTRFVQLVNRRFAIYSRTTSSNTLLSSGTLNQLAGWGSNVNSFDPQIIWDPTTNRFYYAMDSILSSTDNRIAFGWSKTSSPSTAADWCKYSHAYGSEFPDFPKLGDSRFSFMYGVNTYLSSFVRSDLTVWPKPAAGSTCPAPPQGRILKDLRDTSGSNKIFSPTPANGIDAHNFGYAIARSLGVPSSSLWIKPVETTSSSAIPSFKPTRTVSLSTSYTVPPSARQPTFTQVLDTSDTRMTQAVFARNPGRSGSPYSLWTQQTVGNGSFSAIRWYEIDPTFTSPILRRTGLITGASAFVFNAAISPDRRVDGATLQFGDSFVVGYNFSSTSVAARVRSASSLHGGTPGGFLGVVNGSPYRDFSCAGAGQRCRWGDYSAATPDPRPGTSGSGAVWMTNQFGGTGTATTQANWRTWIWAARP